MMVIPQFVFLVHVQSDGAGWYLCTVLAGTCFVHYFYIGHDSLELTLEVAVKEELLLKQRYILDNVILESLTFVKEIVIKEVLYQTSGVLLVVLYVQRVRERCLCLNPIIQKSVPSK